RLRPGTSPHALRIPPHDGHPALRRTADGGFRSALAGFRLSLSCPFRLLHTFHLLRPARGYPRVWIWHPSFGRQRDFDPPEQRAAQRTLRTQPPPSRLLSLSRFSPVIRGTLLHRFPDGTRTVSPVAQHVLVTVLPLPPRRRWHNASVRLRHTLLPSPLHRGL